jgi:hypothetical protein
MGIGVFGQGMLKEVPLPREGRNVLSKTLESIFHIQPNINKKNHPGVSDLYF